VFNPPPAARGSNEFATRTTTRKSFNKSHLCILNAHFATVGTTYAYINQASSKPADGNTRKGERKSGSWYTSRNIIMTPGRSDRPNVLKMRGPASTPRLPARWPSPCFLTTKQTGQHSRVPARQPDSIAPRNRTVHVRLDSLPGGLLVHCCPTYQIGRPHLLPRRRPARPRHRHTGRSQAGRAVATTVRPVYPFWGERGDM
jgi:hypothetical protein